jgi:hypothetical protein
MKTVNEAVAKYKTLGRIIKAQDVPLAVKLSAVVYSDLNDDDTGALSITAMAEALYGLAVSVTDGDHEKAITAVSRAINWAAQNNRKANG